MSKTDYLVEGRDTLFERTRSNCLGNDDRLRDFVARLDHLGAIRVRRLAHSQSIVCEGSPSGLGSGIGERVPVVVPTLDQPPLLLFRQQVRKRKTDPSTCTFQYPPVPIRPWCA